MATFWRFFCVLHFHRAACSTFQTCILNSHWGHTMCGSMTDIQSPTAKIRRGKKERRRKNKRQDENIYGLPYYIGRPQIRNHRAWPALLHRAAINSLSISLTQNIKWGTTYHLFPVFLTTHWFVVIQNSNNGLEHFWLSETVLLSYGI